MLHYQKNGCDAAVCSVATLCNQKRKDVDEAKEKLCPNRPLLPHDTTNVFALLNRFRECKKILRTDEKVSEWIKANRGNSALLIVVQDNRLHCVCYSGYDLHDPSNEEGAWADTMNDKLYQVMVVHN